MRLIHSFPVTPLAYWLKMATLTPLFLVAPNALADLIDGRSKTIDGSVPAEEYRLINAASLTANGATTLEINAQTGSKVTLNGTTVNATGAANGVRLSASEATIANKSRVVSDNTGLSLIRTVTSASSATVSDSEIIGGNRGATVSAESQLTLQSGARVIGTNANSIGIEAFGSRISATDSTIMGGLNGVRLFSNDSITDDALVLNNSHVEGVSGSAIVIQGVGQANTEQVNIEVNNGSTLKGGNGILLEVLNGAAANFAVNNSHLVGDIVVADGSSAEVLLDRGATLTGRLENVENLTVNNDARWVMVGDGSVENLSLNGGGVQFGDAPLPMGDGQWLVGVLGGYSQSDLDMSRGTTGEVDSYYLGAYTTWLDAQSGYYFDGVVKYNRFQNESDVQLSDGKKTKGNYDTNGIGASLEFGRNIKLADDYFVEPYAQLSGVMIDGADYDLDNGLAAKGDRVHSLLGKVGTTVGRNFTWAQGKTVQPYLRAAYVHEFAKNSDVEVNDNRFSTDLSGSRGELGAGIAMTMSDKVSMHVDLDERGRLVDYNCTGSQRPEDPYGKVIKGQLFGFDALDNLNFVETTFEGGRHSIFFEYCNEKDPCQLTGLTNSLTPARPDDPQYPPRIDFAYDADGNLLEDEVGRILGYDSLGRLISVSARAGETATDYHYDSLDTLSGLDTAGSNERRFYQGGDLINQIKGADSSTFVRADNKVLAELQAGADPKSLLLASDDKNSVLCELSRDGRNEVAYSAYGHRADDGAPGGHLGYNGERREAQTGWYLLGNGYRAFNSLLMRFHSPDSWSPFGDGGMNPYAYCFGDPIGLTDKNGHSPVGWLVRAVKLTTKSEVARGIPSSMKMVGKGKSSATLHKITETDVYAAKNKVANYDFEMRSLNGGDVSHDLAGKYTRSVEQLDFMEKNVGKKLITRHSANELESFPKYSEGYVNQAYENRKVFGDRLRQDAMAQARAQMDARTKAAANAAARAAKSEAIAQAKAAEELVKRNADVRSGNYKLKKKEPHFQWNQK